MVERRPNFLAEEDVRIEEIPFSCSLWASGFSVNIHSNIPELQTNLFSKLIDFRNVIPGLEVKSDISPHEQSLCILRHDKTGLYYDPEAQKAYLFGNTADFIDGQGIAWISYWLMERQKQENSLFTLHSSALTLNGRGVLLLGHSGAGKTSIMLNLCQKYRATIVSNDLTVVHHNVSNDQLSLVDGTKEIRLRLASVEKDFPTFRYLFPETKTSSWETKIVVLPEDIGLRSEIGRPELHSIFEVHLDSKATDGLSIYQEEQIPIRYRLYEDMSRIIIGSAISVFDSEQKFLGYMPSLDSEEIHGKRIACIEQMVDRVGITSISGGSINEIAEAIYDLTVN